MCLSHGIFGFVTKSLYLSGVHGAVDFPQLPDVSAATAAADHASAVLDVAVFEPWFLVEGLLLLLAGRQFLRSPEGHRRWSSSVMADTVLVEVFGTVLARHGLHFAIS